MKKIFDFLEKAALPRSASFTFLIALFVFSGANIWLGIAAGLVLLLLLAFLPVEVETKKLPFLQATTNTGFLIVFLSLLLKITELSNSTYFAMTVPLVVTFFIWGNSMILDLDVPQRMSNQNKNDRVMATYMGAFFAGVLFFRGYALVVFACVFVGLFLLDLFTPTTVREKVVNRKTVRTLWGDLLNVFNFSGKNISFQQEKNPDEQEW